MNALPFRVPICAAVLLGAAVSSAQLVVVEEFGVYGLGKLHGFVQLGLEDVQEDTGDPYAFIAFIDRQGLTLADAFILPPDALTVPFDEQDVDGISLDRNFSSKVALDTEFPNGTYTITILDPLSSALLSLGPGRYPLSTPELTNGTWSDGKLLVDNTSAYTLNFNTLFRSNESPFKAIDQETGPVAGDNLIFFGIEGLDFDSTFNFEFLSFAEFTSLTLDAGVLTPGEEYIFELGFMELADYTEEFFDEAAGFSFFANLTSVHILAIPEPDTYALFGLGLIFLGVVAWRRHRTGRE